MKSSLALVVLLVLSNVTKAQKNDDSRLKELNRVSGYWKSEIVNLPSGWYPQEEQLVSETKSWWLPGEQFLQTIEVTKVADESKIKGKALLFWTYDKQEKKYRQWVFQSTGSASQWVGTFVEKEQAFHFEPVYPKFDESGYFSERFSQNGPIQGAMSFQSKNGKSMLNMKWTRTQFHPFVDTHLEKNLYENTAELEKQSDELKVLNFMKGNWTLDIESKPTKLDGKSEKRKGELILQWILDGMFLYGTKTDGSRTFHLVVGFDKVKAKYVVRVFSDQGAWEKEIGSWNQEKQTMSWSNVKPLEDYENSSVMQVIDRDRFVTRNLMKEKNGDVVVDVVITATRKASE